MGCCTSTEQLNKKKIKGIGKIIQDDKRKDQSVKKLLLLGSGGSGKSTLFKQLRTTHGTGYADKDRLQFKDHIFAQIVEQMRCALECIDVLLEEQFSNIDETDVLLSKGNGEGGGEAGGESGIGKTAIKKDIDEVKISYNDLQLSDAGKEAADTLQCLPTLQVTLQVADVIEVLWKERAIKYIYALRATMKLDDSCADFWDDVHRIADPEYVPSDMDILLVRYRTTGVTEQKFEFKRNLFHVFDVGGQISERKKWIHYNGFELVTAVIFCAQLSAYDEVMFENEEKNVMVDSIELFEQICNNEEWFKFKDTAMILFLTKKDLFAQKIERIPLTQCAALKQYAGIGDSYDDGVDYIKQVYESCNQNRHKQVFTHVVNLTDRNEVEKVFNDVQTVIINASLAYHL